VSSDPSEADRLAKVKHRAALRRRWADRNAAVGLCVNCTRPAAPGAKNCEKHLLMALSRKHLGTGRYWAELLALLDAQDRLCPYTGEPLQVGVNASIDHIVPRSRGGAEQIENLHWVATSVNQAKAALLHDEFVALCLVIVARHAPSNDNGGEA
jgi:5-methylcytosine-specific restriction endonuclease McrA